MPTLVKNMGRSKSPSFYSAASGSLKSSANGVKSKLPLFAVLILGGVAIVFILRNKSGASQAGGVAGAPLTVSPSGEADASSIANMIQALNAITLGVQPQAPSGGTSTPITTNPSLPQTENPVVNPSSSGFQSVDLGSGFFTGPNSGQVLNRNAGTTGGISTNSRQGAPIPANLTSVGPLTYPAGLTTEQTATANAQNMSLVDWVIYQHARTGTYVGLYGSNAGAPQQALDAAAIAEAKRRIAAGETYTGPIGH